MKKQKRANAHDVERYAPDAHFGLSGEQVNRREAEGLVNTAPVAAGKSVGQIIFTNVFTYFNLVFVIFAFFLVVVQSYKNLTFLPVVLINSLIGIVQEIRAKRVLDRLNLLNAPKATVIRNGKEYEVSSEKLVLDDVIVLGSGNQICADAVVMEGEVQVNESLMTGEADEITKRQGDSLMSGSFVVSGKCRARLEAVGEDSYVSKLSIEAKSAGRRVRSGMMKALDKIVKIVGVATIPLAAGLVLTRFFVLHDGWTRTVVTTVGALVGLVPEGLYLLASIALAVSVMRLAKKKVLVHEMSCIETLARVDVLCVDKTGTITSEEMSVDSVVELPEFDGGKYGELDALLSDFARSGEGDNLTSTALRAYFKNVSPGGRKAIGTTPFSSKTKYSAVKFSDGTYVLGAPEFVMREDFVNIENDTKKFFENGFRVLVFGFYEGDADGSALTEKVTPLALVLLSNPIRHSAVETFKFFADQGVQIKVISGDNPVAVSKIAMEANVENSDKFVDSSTLTTDELLFDAADKYNVFGRTTPEQKRKLINALREKGHTVAMVGDGVNDVLALKDADCGVAMASGSDAAGQAAELVLMDSNFSSMPSVVAEGRRVVNNIQRSASLFLVKNIFSFLTTLLAICALLSYPLVPSQVSLIGAFTIGIPAFFLAMEPNKNRIRGNFLANVFVNAIPAGLTDFLLIGAMIVIGRVSGFTIGEISTASAFIMAFVGIVMIIKISRPLNPFRAVIAVVMTVGLLISGYILRGLLDFIVPSANCFIFAVALAAASIPLMILFGFIAKKIYMKFAVKKAWEENTKIR